MPILAPKGNTQARPDLAATLETFGIEADRKGFIGHRLFPVMEVGTQHGRFPKLDTRLWLVEEDTSRASGGSYNRASVETGWDGFITTENAKEVAVDEREAAILKTWFDAEILATRRAYDIVLRSAEIRIANMAFNPDKFVLKREVGIPWNLPNSSPTKDIDVMCKAFRKKNGVYPTGLVMTKDLFLALRRNEEVKEEIRSSGAGESTVVSKITERMLAEVFGLEQILVAGGSVVRNGNPGRSTVGDISDIWDSTRCGLFCIPSTNDLREPAFGRTFHWGGDGSQVDGIVETYYEDSHRSEIVRVRHETDERILLQDLGALFINCLDPNADADDGEDGEDP